ncbi:CP12 domain containing protein [Nitzschia inconspicua]|uniref:CP12 domain containing protein n=1 Tax=Nitzschia inconspicua TaxID=303405 RepID=A0A9K3PPP4_9STRA|nr:CP12 domain containing protein [Nitzschia inconspicua]
MGEFINQPSSIRIPLLIAFVLTAISFSVPGSDGFVSTISTHHHGIKTTAADSLQSSVLLFGNSKNIKAAMEATERYGIDSPEARLAWEVVEEFDARTNDSAAYTPNQNNRLSDEQMANAYAELQHTLQIMERRRMAFQQNDQLMRDVAAELQAIKLAPPSQKPAPKIPGLWDAKLKARAISQQYGNTSVEAKLAWEEVEEIAAAGLENAMGEEWSEQTCDLAQAAEACMALEELERFLYQEQYDQNMNGGDGSMYQPY